jgi:hypothetical protein
MGVAQTVAWELGVLPHIAHAAQTAAWKLGAGWWCCWGCGSVCGGGVGPLSSPPSRAQLLLGPAVINVIVVGGCLGFRV